MRCASSRFCYTVVPRIVLAMSGKKSLAKQEIVSILECDEEISSLSSSDSESDNLINAESECRSDVSGSSSGNDDRREVGVAVSTASYSGWSCVNNHDVGPNISILIQNIEPGHFDKSTEPLENFQLYLDATVINHIVTET
ncbi:hypothetical protein C0J52_24184 [Blattella germanica]|nr:hypothetical protein C0J52_24184 [Blattella germanica]